MQSACDKGTVLAEYKGVIRHELDYKGGRLSMSHSFRLDCGRVLDGSNCRCAPPEFGGSAGSLVNHSNTPNAAFVTARTDREGVLPPRVFLVAKRYLHAGEEVLARYGNNESYTGFRQYLV